MNTIQLPRNVQFLYEEHLARLEFGALGCETLTREGDRWDQMTAHVNGTSALVLERSAYAGTLDGRPSVYAQLIKPSYQGGRYNRTRSVNQYLTHWIYPYRGKFHPQMIRALLNVLDVRPGDRLLEPYLGSGTAALEASLLGIDCVGVDLSPLCVLLSRVKVRSHEAAPAIRAAVEALDAREDLTPDSVDLEAYADERVRDFITVARMVTYSDVSRRSRAADAWFRKNLRAMLESVEAHAAAVATFNLTPGQVDARLGSSCDLRAAGVEDNSCGAAITSPPYSIALDYVKNDAHALEALGVDMDGLRATMTGVRGRGAKQKLALYNADMKAMFASVARALKPGAPAAFVIGDATVDHSEVTTTEEMATWAEAAGLRLERRIPKIVFGLYSVMIDEKILIFRKV